MQPSSLPAALVAIALTVGLPTTLPAPPAGAAGGGGAVLAFGDVSHHGDLRTVGGAPMAGIAGTPSGNGYWLVASNGGVFTFGDAPFHGSAGGAPLNRPVTDIAATPPGDGYWLAASDGGVFAFGDAAFHGSLGGQALRAPIVGMAGTPDGDGYWLAASDGGVFAFGDAVFHGSAAGEPPDASVVGIESAPGRAGYWLATGEHRVDLGIFEATCYALRGTTASGRPVGEDVIAVDPRVIPLGTRLYVESQGERIAADTGGAIDGRRIDVWKPLASQCTAFGRRDLRVWRLG